MNNRDRIFLLLSQNKTIDEITEEVDLGYSTVLKYKKEYKEAELEGKLDMILSQDELIIEQIASEISGDATHVIQSMKGLDRLNDKMQESAQLILVKLKTVVSNVGPDDVGDLAVATRVLCDLQNAFFNKNTINIQNNNYDSGQAVYGEFLSDKPNNN